MPVDVFGLRDRVVEQYSDYIRSFLRIKDPEIGRFVQESLSEGRYWPEPLVQLNPAFEPGDSVDELVAKGILAEGCRRIFRRNVDHVLRHGAGRGIKAIVVYPMNALCNSQVDELNKYLKTGFPAGEEPVTFERYTGQESQEQRAAVAASPPDILLTNFIHRAEEVPAAHTWVRDAARMTGVR